MKFDALKASLQDPTDDTDVTIVMDVASVGTTRKLSSGQIVKWTEEALKKFGPSLINTPINLDLKADGRAGDHSSNDIGTVRQQAYDPERKTLTAIGTLWEHAHPATIAQLRKLYADKDVDVSMEFRAKELTDNDDDTVTPADGRFGGVGLVGGGADLGAGIVLLASALKEDEEKNVEPTTNAPVGSFEWISLNAAEHIANNVVNNKTTATVTATYPDYIIYTTNTTAGPAGNNTTYRMNFDPTAATSGTITFGEPVKVTPTFVPLEGSRQEPQNPIDSGEENMPDEKEFAELKASRDALETQLTEKTKELDTLKAELDTEKEKQAQELKASARIEEVEKIAPYTDDKLKDKHRELFKTADDQTFEGIKELVASMAELRGGIHSDEGHAPAQGKDEVETEALKQLPAWKEELKAHFGAPATK